MEMNKMVFTKGLTKKYGAETVVQNVSISVRKNSIYGLLGPNGSGKSTLINILTKEITNYQGIVEISGMKKRCVFIID